jgi:hypothetical protein
MNISAPSVAAAEVVDQMAKKLSLVRLDHHLKDRADGPYLIIEVAEPSERFYRALRDVQSTLPERHLFGERATVSRRQKARMDRLALPETQLLKATLSESLTVDRHTFSDDFFSRYTRSVFGYEDQIIATGNYIVYGRRGSGKSSLLAYAMHNCKRQGLPHAWIDLQTYAGRADIQVSVDVIGEILAQLSQWGSPAGELSFVQEVVHSLATMPDAEAEKALVRVLPRVKRAMADVAATQGDIAIFLDDIHLVSRETQPRLLGYLYSATRGNRCHLKLSGIEQFSRPWDSSGNVGLQPPHDAQPLKLDYNLTMPDKSRDHIGSILDAHARFCGLPSVSYVAGEGVLSRLVWVAAAVPRDALHLFAQAMTKAAAHGQRRVSITSINAAASDMAEQKLKDMQQDRREDGGSVDAVLERIKAFCITEKKKNAFLLEIRNDDVTFVAVQELIALRLVHVLHEGITPHEAGRRYQALMLDYGFYVGIRAAKSVDLFQREPHTPSVQDLRRLPIWSTH